MSQSLSGGSYEARFPFFLGCAFMVLICFPAIGELPGNVPLATAAMLPSIPFWLRAAIARRALIFDDQATKGIGVIMPVLGFLVLWAFLSVLNSDTPFRSGRVITTLLAGFAIFLLIAGTVTSRRLSRLVHLLCFSLALTCLVSFVAYFEPHLRPMIFLESSDRASGFFKNPNQFGMAISTVLPTVAAAVLGRFGGRIVWLGCLVALLIGLVMCGSKTNLLISSATLVFILICYPAIIYSGAKRAVMVALGLAFAVTLLAATTALLETFNPRALHILLQLTEEDGEVRSLMSRQQLWLQSIEQFRADPILGQGAGQPVGTLRNPVPHSHNVLLDYLRSMGAPGFMGLTVVLVTILVLSVNSIRLAFSAKGSSARDRILCIGLATGSMAYIAANFSSDSMGPSTSPFFWTVLFLGLAARAQLRRSDRPLTGTVHPG